MAIDVRQTTYTTIRDARYFQLVPDLSHPDTVLLQQISDALTAAGSDFVARRYQDAIADYKKAQTLIWSQLDPGLKAGSGFVGRVPFDTARLSTLLETSLNWLSVLPVPGPLSPVNPLGPDSAKEFPAFDQVGLLAPAVSTPASAEAASAARLSAIFTAQGSKQAGSKFEQHAISLDRNVADAVLALPADGGITHRVASLFTKALTRTTGQPSALAAEQLSSGSAAAATAAGQSAAVAPVITTMSEDITVLPTSLTQQRQIGVATGSLGSAQQMSVSSFDFAVGTIPDSASIEKYVYASRVGLSILPDILAQPISGSDFVLSLAHTFYFIIPMGLGDCYAALGDWPNAETCYLQAAAYQYINTQIEAPQLWAKIAALYVAWGDSLYRNDDPPSALPIYERIVTQAGAVPNSVLYTTTGIGAGAQVARAVIPTLAQLIGNPAAVAAVTSPAIVGPIIDAFVKLGQIKAGLDFHGHWAPSVPIWTFEYLQEVAGQFCQLAVTVEQNVINYWDRADQAQLTRLQLTQHVADCQAEAAAATLQVQAASAEAAAYQAGLALADLRAQDATQNAADYQSSHSQSILYAAESSEVSGGDDGDPDYLNSLADQFQSGQTISGDKGDIGAAVQLVSSRLSLQYEVASMQRTATEMQGAATQAAAEVTAANARVVAAQGQVALAQLHTSEAQAVVGAFDDMTFTAGVWKAMGDRMYQIYRRYLDMALRAAKMMQSAYNFENDTSMTVIRADYSTDEIRGLLAADMLMADVQSFTDTLLGTRRTKAQPVTHVLSLATRHSYLFETQFRKTGQIAFDTTPDDFDLAYPGTYGGRIRHVEVTLVGLTQPTGIFATLTCGGLSFYRTPTDTWTDQDTDHMRRRVQTAETLVISDFDRRTDPAAALGDPHETGILAGAGVIGSWVLDVPMEVNDLDYNLVTDVLVSFTYDTRYDPQLATQVRQMLDTQPGAHTTQIGLPLRWLYPDTFFNLVNNHTATLTVAPSDLPLNHTATQLTQVGLLVTTSGGHSPSALTLNLTAPGAGSAAAAVTDTGGLATSTTTGSPLTTQLGRPVVGDWTITVPDTGNPAWLTSGALDLTSLANLTLMLEYSYTPRSAA
ncbi:hypothetical protein ABH920_006516 [Catenulispora sp. EB89]|uniref:Tc toxin subunit A-related protein n=1 Tax=Catenulispora sp. EB89 TaxID=3156257 RepID=UPI003518D015